MKAESIEILEKYINHWQTLKKAGYMNRLDYNILLEVQGVYQTELQPGYTENLWCGDCVANMFRVIYTQYEKHLEAQTKVEAPKEEKKIVFAVLPDEEEPASAPRKKQPKSNKPK